MPLARFDRMAPDMRERLLTAAAREFAAYGFEAASLNRLLDAAHVGKSSAYYYFEDKADLFCAVVRYCVERLQLAPSAEVIAALTAEAYWQAFAEAHNRPLLLSRGEPWLFGALRAAERLTDESLRRPSLAELTRDLKEYMLTGMGTMLARGQALGLVRDDLPTELLLAWFQAIDAASDDWIVSRPEPMDEAALARLCQQTIEAIQRVLAPPAQR